MKFEKTNKTQLFIGLFDKNTKKQEISSEIALQYVNDLLTTFFEGATSFLCQGVYKHLDGSIIVEPSIAVLLYDIEIESIQAFTDKIKTVLNQESVCIEETETNVCFY